MKWTRWNNTQLELILWRRTLLTVRLPLTMIERLFRQRLLLSLTRLVMQPLSTKILSLMSLISLSLPSSVRIPISISPSFIQSYSLFLSLSSRTFTDKEPSRLLCTRPMVSPYREAWLLPLIPLTATTGTRWETPDFVSSLGPTIPNRDWYRRRLWDSVPPVTY